MRSFVMDFASLANFPRQRLAALSKLDILTLVFWKMVYVVYSYLLPLYLWGLSRLLLTKFIESAISSFMTGLFIQSAHVNMEANQDTTKLPRSKDWAARQIMSTVNYCADNPFLTQFFGGLNMHVEHHLFPSVSWLHYTEIRPIVKATCKEFRIVYSEHTLWQHITSHYYKLKELGSPPSPQQQPILSPRGEVFAGTWLPSAAARKTLARLRSNPKISFTFTLATPRVAENSAAVATPLPSGQKTTQTPPSGQSTHSTQLPSGQNDQIVSARPGDLAREPGSPKISFRMPVIRPRIKKSGGESPSNSALPSIKLDLHTEQSTEVSADTEVSKEESKGYQTEV
jgi:hypothetical protein